MRTAVLLAACACGRLGFEPDAGTADTTPDLVDWQDFTNLSSARTLSGISTPLELSLIAVDQTGTPRTQFRTDGGDWHLFGPGSPGTVTLADGDSLQFLVSGSLGHASSITIVNVSDGDLTLDATRGTVQPTPTGDGTSASPYTAVGPAPASCAEFLTAYPGQAGLDGIYSLDPGTPLDAYCDMTTDGGGWTLVARVLGTSTTHATASAIGTLTDPAQPTTAKLADAMINTLAFTRSRFAIESIGAIYGNVAPLALSTQSWQRTNAAALTVDGPYTLTLATSTGCESDCGVDVVPSSTLGSTCAYRYYSSGGTPRPGMGCRGNYGKPGTVWVR